MSMKGKPQRYCDPEKVKAIIAALKKGARATQKIADSSKMDRTTTLSYLYKLKRMGIVTLEKNHVVHTESKGTRKVHMWIPVNKAVRDYLAEDRQKVKA